MADIEETKVQTPASWDDYPYLQDMWNAFVDIYWGKGGNTSYHQMLLEDEQWLRNAYLQNNQALTAIEQQYVGSVSDTARQYEQGMQGGAVSMGFGPQNMTFTPRATARTLDSLKQNRNEAALAQLAAGQQQAGRIMDYAKEMPPNVANTAYLNSLQQLGMKGQDLRSGLPSVTGTADVDTPTVTDISNWVGLGTSLVDIGKGLVGSDTSWINDLIGDWDWGNILGGSSGSSNINTNSFLETGIPNPWS